MPKKKKKASKTGGAYTPKPTPVRQSKARRFVEGKSVPELLKNGSAHLHQYTESNLQAIVTRLSSAANKRLKRFEASGMADSPAVMDVKASGGRFSGKGKDKEGLKAEFLRLKKFFEDPTSTQAGWEQTQARATREAQKRGVLSPPTPKGRKMPSPVEVEGFVEGGEYADPEVMSSWTYDSKSDTYKHPIYGEGWVYDSSIDGYVDPVTGEVVQNPSAPRMYHDYDATADWRRTESGTETGDLWRMVDSIAKLDPAFSRGVSGGDSGGVGKTLRNRLFDAIDEAYVNHPGWTLEEARDYVAGRLEEIKREQDEFLGDAASIGKSEFM